jgi:hypothetical protein
MGPLWRDSVLKRVLGVLMLGVVLIATLGALPSPTMVSGWFGRVISEPFPCQDHSCGCGSAHECWSRCGCFTTDQRLAWAERRGVRPPPGFRGMRVAGAAGSQHSSASVDDCKVCEGTGAVAGRAAGRGSCAEAAREVIARIASEACGQGWGPVPGSTPAAEFRFGHVQGDVLGVATELASSCCGVSERRVSGGGDHGALAFASPLTCKGLSGLLAVALVGVAPVRLCGFLPPPVYLPWFGRPTDDCFATRELDVSVPPPRVA